MAVEFQLVLGGDPKSSMNMFVCCVVTSCLLLKQSVVAERERSPAKAILNCIIDRWRCSANVVIYSSFARLCEWLER